LRDADHVRIEIGGADLQSPLTDSNRRPLLTILGPEREARAPRGHRGHETAANRTDPTQGSDRAWTRVDGLMFAPCSHEVVQFETAIRGRRGKTTLYLIRRV
jgi:hypothetical protein